MKMPEPGLEHLAQLVTNIRHELPLTMGSNHAGCTVSTTQNRQQSPRAMQNMEVSGF